MEVTVVSAEGAPEGSLLSIRAGGARRQGPINSKHPFKFPTEPTAGGAFKIDLLGVIATARLVPRPDENTYTANFTTSEGKEITLGLNVQTVAGGVRPDTAPPPVTPLMVEAEAAAADGAASKSKRHGIALEAKNYLDEHQLTSFLQSTLQTLLKERPKDPYAWMSRLLQGADRPNKDYTPQRPATSPDPKMPPEPNVNDVRQKTKDALDKALSDGSLEKEVLGGTKGSAEIKPAEVSIDDVRQKARDSFARQSSKELADALEQNWGAQAAPAPDPASAPAASSAAAEVSLDDVREKARSSFTRQGSKELADALKQNSDAQAAPAPAPAPAPAAEESLDDVREKARSSFTRQSSKELADALQQVKG